jgi:mannose-6-phosphate isomerase
MSERCPLLPTTPVLVEKIWGGDRMGPRVGEAWHVSDLPNGQSQHLGEDLHAWVARYGRSLVGERAEDDARFPLLLKLIDAADDLSVQVHPSKAAAAERPGAHPKDETWLILEKDAGARVLHGFNAGVDRAAFEAATEAGHPEDLLRAVPVEPGDVVRVVPGTMHAIGRGTFLLELQEPRSPPSAPTSPRPSSRPRSLARATTSSSTPPAIASSACGSTRRAPSSSTAGAPCSAWSSTARRSSRGATRWLSALASRPSSSPRTPRR